MPRTRYRHGRKDHTRRVKEYRREAATKLIEAGLKIQADRVEAMRPKHEPLIPFVEDATI